MSLWAPCVIYLHLKCLKTPKKRWLFTVRIWNATKRRELVIWKFNASYFKMTKVQRATRCYFSQRNNSHHDSQTSLQAVVTNYQFLAAQFKGSRTFCLLKLVMRVQRNKDGAWEAGAKVKPECYNYFRNWNGCLVKARRCFSSSAEGVKLWQRGRGSDCSLHIHHMAANQLESHSENDHDCFYPEGSVFLLG